MSSPSQLQLADYRRQVAECYARVRESELAPEIQLAAVSRRSGQIIQISPANCAHPKAGRKFHFFEIFPIQSSIPVQPPG